MKDRDSPYFSEVVLSGNDNLDVDKDKGRQFQKPITFSLSLNTIR